MLGPRMSNLKKTSYKQAAKARSKSSTSLAFAPPFSAWAGVLLIIVVVSIAYAPSLSGGFLFDDDVLLTGSQLIKIPGGLSRIWSSQEVLDFWPATNTTFWLEWRLWNMHPAGYHVTNVILHIIEALMVWLILRKLSIPGAFLAALIFALHPVNVESAAWIASRKNLMAMLFFLLSILWYLKFTMSAMITGTEMSSHGGPWERVSGPGTGRPWERVSSPGPLAASSGALAPSPWFTWYWLSLAAFLLAMLSKGSVAILPVLLLRIIWWLRPLTRRDLAWTAPFFAIGLALAAVSMWFQTHGSGYVFHAATVTERLLGAGRVIWFYLYKALLPVDLAFVYPQWHISAGNPLWWLPLSGAIAVTAVLWMFRKGWGRPLLFAWGFFCVALLPVMGFADVGFMQLSLVADRYQHIAIIAIIALTAASFSIWRQTMRGSIGWIASGIVVAGAVVSLAFLTWRQSGVYRDELTLYRFTLEKNPACWIAHNNWGLALDRAGQTQEAIAHFRKALALKSDYAEAHNNWGLALNKAGRPEEAVEHFRQALNLSPDYYRAQNNWGVALDKLGRSREAIEHYKQALAQMPDNPEFYNNLATSLIQLGEPLEAIKQCEHALAINPDDAKTHNNLGSALLNAGQIQEAIEHYEQALRLNPDYADAHCNLGCALVQIGHFQEAIEQCRQALALNPKSSEAYNTWGNALQSAGEYQQAIEQYEAALKLNPEYTQVHINLGSTLLKTGKTAEAMEHYRQALRLKPNSFEAHNNLGNALQSVGKYQEAIEHFESALLINPNFAQVHINLAYTLAQAGRFSEAIEHYRQALSLNPDLTNVYLNLALLYSKNKQSAEAVEIAQKGLELARARGQVERARQIELWLNSHGAGPPDTHKDQPDAGTNTPTR